MSRQIFIDKIMFNMQFLKKLTFLLIFFVKARSESASDDCHWQSETEGNMTTPNYPDKYPPNTQCHVNIWSNPEYNIELTFHDFFLESGYTYGCAFDYVEIVDFQQKKYVRKCGRKAPFKLMLSSKVQIFFKSDNETEMKGFKASWRYVHKNSELQYSTTTFIGIFKRLKDTEEDNSNQFEMKKKASQRSVFKRLYTTLKDVRIEPTRAAFLRHEQGTNIENRNHEATGIKLNGTSLIIVCSVLFLLTFVVGSIVFQVKNRLASARQHAEVLDKIDALQNCHKGYMHLDFQRCSSVEYNTIQSICVNGDGNGGGKPDVKFGNLLLE